MDRRRRRMVRGQALDRSPRTIIGRGQRMDRCVDRSHDDAAGPRAAGIARRGAHDCGKPCGVPLGARVSRSVPRCGRPPERHRGLRCRDRQSTVGHAARRQRLGGRPRDHAIDDDGDSAILPLDRDLPPSRRWASQQLPVVRRTGAAPDQARGTGRARPPLGHRHRSRQRAAAQAPVRCDGNRHLAGLRQPGAHFSDSPQRALRGAVHHQCRLHRHLAFAVRPDRSTGARPGRPEPAAACDRPRAPRGMESRSSDHPPHLEPDGAVPDRQDHATGARTGGYRPAGTSASDGN